MIRGSCFTNLDEFNRARWPGKFVAVPRIGDRVEGEGDGVVSRPTLRVVGVTHRMVDDNPEILVELHR